MAQIYGELIRAQLQVSSSALSPTAIGLIYFNSGAGTDAGINWYSGSAWKTAVDLNSSQTLSTKTLDSSCIISSASSLPLIGKTNLTTALQNEIDAKVSGPASSTDNAVARFDLTTGALLQNSLVTINDLGEVEGATKLTVDSIQLDSATIQSVSANVDLFLSANGTGVVRSLKNLSVSSDNGLTLGDASGAFGATIKPASTLTNSRIHRIPDKNGDFVLDLAEQNLVNKVVSSTGTTLGALKLPGGTDIDRPSPGVNGYIRYNSDSDSFEGYTTAGWAAIAGGGGGTIDKVTQASHGFALGDTLYLNGSTYTKAIATSAAAAEVVGVVSKIVDANNFELTLSGEVNGLSGLTAGEVYFLSAATAGLLTVTEPSTVGQVSVPVGIASSTTSLYVAPKRGVVVGGTNARANVSLTSGATTNVQNLAGYDAGELTGWVFISSAAPVRFYVSAKFAKSGPGSDYNLSYQTTGDTTPSGFSLQISTSGLLSCTLPASSGSTSVINYALNAPAIGASFPLTVDAGTILSGTVDAGRLPAPTAYSNSDATRMGLKSYLHGTSYNGGLAPTATCPQAGFTVLRAMFVPYQMQDGGWRLKFNLQGDFTSASVQTITVSVNGILTSSAYTQSISAIYGGNSTGLKSYALINSNQLQTTTTASITANGVCLSGDIELASKPTWAY
jgi:hypothetical protein